MYKTCDVKYCPADAVVGIEIGYNTIHRYFKNKKAPTEMIYLCKEHLHNFTYCLKKILQGGVPNPDDML